jgi:hypothetical protein
LLLEVLLDVRRLVLDVQARLHAVRDDPCSVAKGRRRGGPRQAQREEEADAVGPTEIEVLADDGFEEVAARHRPVEDMREAHFELADGEAVVVTGGSIEGGHRPGEAMRPAIEEGLHIGGGERITRGLQDPWDRDK